MATYWVRSLMANDTGDGTTYATAKQLIASGLGLMDTAGDILNIVADGDYTWDFAETILSTSLTGISYTDFGAKIRGVDGAGENPAMVTLVASGAGNRGFIRMNNTTNYIIVENFIFDSSAIPTEAGIHSAVHMYSNSAGPVKMRYCTVIGGNSGTVSTGVRALFYATTGSSTDSFIAEYCYFQNCRSPMGSTGGYGGTLVKAKMDHCVGIWDATGRTNSWYNDTTWLASATNDITLTYNTFYETVGNNSTATIFDYSPADGLSMGDINVHSNLVWTNSTKAGTCIDQFLEGGAGAATVTYSGVIGTNVLLGGPNVVAADLLSPGGWYTGAWDSGNDAQTSDTVAYAVADTAVFNDPASTYDWEMPNGLIITILKDLRPILYTDKGRFAGVPGALPSAVEEEDEVDSPIDPGDEVSNPFIDVFPIIGTDLAKDATIRVSTKENRAQAYYNRFDEESVRWREYSAHTLELATNTTTRLRMGGIETGKTMIVEATNPIQISIGSDTNLFQPVNVSYMALKSSFEVLLLKNASTTNSSTVILTVVDQ